MLTSYDRVPRRAVYLAPQIADHVIKHLKLLTTDLDAE